MARRRYDTLFDVVLIGDAEVGKSQIMDRFTWNKFCFNYEATIAASYEIGTLVIDDDESVEVRVWSNIGLQRCIGSRISDYYLLAHGALLVYDITKPESFNHIPYWLKGVRDGAHDDIVIILIGNKLDLESQRAVPIIVAESFAQEEGLFFLEISALDGTNVEMAFVNLFTTILTNKKNPKLPEKFPKIQKEIPEIIPKKKVLEQIPEIIPKVPEQIPEIIPKVPEQIPEIIPKVPEQIPEIPKILEKISEIKNSDIPAKKKLFSDMDLTEAVFGLFPICQRSRTSKRLTGTFDLLKLKVELLFNVRDILEEQITKDLMLGKNPLKESQIWLTRVEKIDTRVQAVIELEQKGSRFDASLHKRLMNLLDEIVLCLEKSPLELGQMVDVPYEKSKRKRATNMTFNAKLFKFREEVETKAKPDIDTGESPSQGKGIAQKKEMRKPKDVELIARSVDWSIPVHDFEKT